MIIDKTQTLLIQPECIATILSRHVVIEISDEKVPEASSDPITPRVVDPVLLSVFGHRFTSR
jgi:5-oxoprolinase (ATP-hydrolysing)